MSTWSDEEKQAVINAYLDSNPTAENSIEILKQIAAEHNKTVNGVRMILLHADVYISKPKTTTETKTDKPVRVSKADSINALKSIIEDNDLIPDSAILDKMTGKAAQYFADILVKIKEQ